MAADDTHVLPRESLEDDPTAPPPPQPPFLSARRLSARGPEGEVYAGVSVDAGLGELVAIVGEGGTGRTSLLLTLTGRFRHRTGTVFVDGHSDPARIREYAAVATAAPAVVPDEYLTVGDLTAERLVIGGAEVTPASVVEACTLFEIAPDPATKYGMLDAPTKVLFALALAAAEHRPIIAIDDVGEGLDRSSAHRVWTALRTLAAHGHLVLATTAQPDIADVTVHLPHEDPDATRIVPAVGGHREHDEKGGEE